MYTQLAAIVARRDKKQFTLVVVVVEHERHFIVVFAFSPFARDLFPAGNREDSRGPADAIARLLAAMQRTRQSIASAPVE